MYFTEDDRMKSEIHNLFRSRPPTDMSQNASGPSTSSCRVQLGESLFSRTERLCKKLRPGKSIKDARKNYKPYMKKTPSKMVQKGLVLVCYQHSDTGDTVPLREHEKLFDGCIRYKSDMSEEEIREEITRLIHLKDSHSFTCLMPSDFDFVRCINRRLKPIDGDVPFDSDGISHVYKNGSIYVRLNSQKFEVSIPYGRITCTVM